MHRHRLVLHHCVGEGGIRLQQSLFHDFLESLPVHETADNCGYQYNKTKMARHDRRLKEMLSGTLSSLESNRKFAKKAASYR